MEEFFTNVIVGNIYFSNHDAVKVAVQKKYLDFHINPSNLLQPAKKEEF